MSLNNGCSMHTLYGSHLAFPNTAAVVQQQLPGFYYGPAFASLLETAAGTVTPHQGLFARTHSGNRNWIDSRRFLWLQTTTSNRSDAHDRRELAGLQRQLPTIVSRLLEPAEFEASKLRVEFMRGSSSSDSLDTSRINSSRVYTLTHCDVTAALHLTIGKKVNHRQLRGWYQRLLRDEVIARWHMRPSGDNSLHVHCHVSGAHALMAPAVLRNWIFTREMPVVLQAIRYGDQALLSRQPELCMAPVWVHFQSDSEEFHRAELWGPLFFAASGVGLSDPSKANTCRAFMDSDTTQMTAAGDLVEESSVDGAIMRDVSSAAEPCRESVMAEVRSSDFERGGEEEEEACSASDEPGIARRKVYVGHGGKGLPGMHYRQALLEANGGRGYVRTEVRLNDSTCASVGLLDLPNTMDGQLLADMGLRRDQRLAVGSNSYYL